jgi:mRNA interferase YafQ
MRTIEWTGAFNRDFQREKKRLHRLTVEDRLAEVVEALAHDRLLLPANRDHQLGGEWSGFRECHVKPDLLLIYEKPTLHVLRLVRVGSHAELFG